MLIIPAIDLKDGRCVRLLQGRADAVTEYSGDPVGTALRWASEGARCLHVVDLDGAFQGRPVHGEIIEDIVKACGIPVEVGGGLRTDNDIRQMLDYGVARAIVGTRAFTDRSSLRELAEEFGSRLGVGIDAKDGMVQVKGWVETTGISAVDLAVEADRAGVATLVCTDTSRDGMLEGVNTDAIDKVCTAVSCEVIASGGVSSVDDVRALAALGKKNLEGVITGKALYEGTVSFQELAAAAGGV